MKVRLFSRFGLIFHLQGHEAILLVACDHATKGKGGKLRVMAGEPLASFSCPIMYFSSDLCLHRIFGKFFDCYVSINQI